MRVTVVVIPIRFSGSTLVDTIWLEKLSLGSRERPAEPDDQQRVDQVSAKEAFTSFAEVRPSGAVWPRPADIVERVRRVMLLHRYRLRLRGVQR